MNRLLSLIALGLALGIFFGYINPTWSGSIAAAKNAIQADNDALTAANEFNSKQNELASARNAIDSGNLSRLESFLPDSVANVGLILDLNALAARSGISLTSIDVAQTDTSSSGSATALPVTGDSPVGSIDLQLSAIGTYASLHAFLEGVERSARLLDVTELTVKGSDTGVYTYSMTMRLYWLR